MRFEIPLFRVRLLAGTGEYPFLVWVYICACVSECAMTSSTREICVEWGAIGSLKCFLFIIIIVDRQATSVIMLLNLNMFVM